MNKSKDIFKQTSPLIKQYLSIKSAHKNHLLFYRLGDFYELFFEDARIASNILGIVLTKRRYKNKIVPLCGVPYHSSTHYINKILKHKHTVAICEQLESLSEAKKRGYKSIINREVIKIITPGTALEEKLLNPKISNYLVCAYQYKNEYAISWGDLSTGDLKTITCYQSNICDEIFKLQPSEIILSQKFLNCYQTLLKKFNEDETTILSYNDHVFDYSACCNIIKEYYGINSLKGIVKLSKVQVITCAILIEYSVRTQKKYLPRLKKIKNMSKSQFMEIDLSSRKNLEIERSCATNNKLGMLNVINKTISPGGNRLLKEVL